MYSNNPEILEDGTEYYPPINSCSYDEHELDMYFLGDNYGKDEDLYFLKGSIDHAN